MALYQFFCKRDLSISNIGLSFIDSYRLWKRALQRQSKSDFKLLRLSKFELVSTGVQSTFKQVFTGVSNISNKFSHGVAVARKREQENGPIWRSKIFKGDLLLKWIDSNREVCSMGIRDVWLSFRVYPLSPLSDMGWLRLVGSLKLYVSFAEYSLFYRALLQKRPTILRSLLTVATP